MILFLNMCILIGKSLAVFRNCYLSLHSFFLVKNVKITFFAEKRVLNICFIEFKCRLLQTSLADMEKHLTFVFFLRVDFLRIFENITFFEIFENHQ